MDDSTIQMLGDISSGAAGDAVASTSSTLTSSTSPSSTSTSSTAIANNTSGGTSNGTAQASNSWPNNDNGADSADVDSNVLPEVIEESQTSGATGNS